MSAELVGQRVCVHLNLTTKRFVISTKPKGTILGCADDVTLDDVTFKVYEAQRLYCVQRRSRWVHAYALGTLVSTEATDTTGMVEITYNPFRAPTFHVSGQERPVYGATRVHFRDEHCYAAESSLRKETE